MKELNVNDGIFIRSLPNPLHTTTTINYTLPSDCRVTLSIYNANGQLKRTVINNEMRARGIYDLNTAYWFPEAGVYYVTFKLKSNFNEYLRTIKLVKIKEYVADLH